MDNKFDVTVVGGGPGGYVAAIRAAQLGMRTVLVERERIGGVCMNWGCIPTKYLLEQTKLAAAAARNSHVLVPGSGLRLDWAQVQAEKQRVVDRLVRGIEFLLQKNKVRVVSGSAVILGSGRVAVEGCPGQEIESRSVILAAGSRAAELPFLHPNGREILDSRQALDMTEVPARLCVIGAGAVGLELGTIFHRLGSEVLILEMLPNILPGSDKEMSARLERILKQQELSILTGMRLDSCRVDGGRVRLAGTCLKDQKPFDIETDRVLLAVGRRPNSEFLDAPHLGLSLDEAGFVRVNQRMETSLRGVFAIGDLAGGKLLAHKASHEGMTAAENASGRRRETASAAVPMAVFTDPEFASVGLTSEEAEEKGIHSRRGLFSLQANGRALTMGQTEGMVKIIADDQDRILGAHLIAPHASELITEMTMAVSRRLSLKDVADTIHIHPTLSESLMEAAMKARGEAIHALNE